MKFLVDYVTCCCVFILFIYWNYSRLSVEISENAYFLENVMLDCDPIYKNKTLTAKKYKEWKLYTDHVAEALEKDFCKAIQKYFIFEKVALSEEEKTFPLAYGLIVHNNIVQVLLQLSIFYQPQNQFCITVDEFAEDPFKSSILKLPTCFNNMAAFIGQHSGWGEFGIVQNMFNCVDYLARLESDWKYYQYLSGVDVPIRTNLEMVRIMRALNGSINTDVELIEKNRLNHLRTIRPPADLYKGSMSVALPRAAANYLIKSRKIQNLLKYLSYTKIPDEAVWTTIAGNKKDIPIPGGFDARDILYLRYHRQELSVYNVHTVDHIGSSFIGRFQIWWTQPNCNGKWASTSCVYGVYDIPAILKRPELIAHKFYLDYQPAAMICLLKEIRRRSYNPEPFVASSYSEMPTVELHSGKSLKEISHPDWVRLSSFA